MFHTEQTIRTMCEVVAMKDPRLYYDDVAFDVTPDAPLVVLPKQSLCKRRSAVWAGVKCLHNRKRSCIESQDTQGQQKHQPGDRLFKTNQSSVSLFYFLFG